MTRTRICIFYSLLGILLLGHAADVLLHREHWPFSSYPMFAGITPNRYSVYELDCLANVNGVQQEIPVKADWVPTLSNEALQNILSKACAQSAKNPQRLRQTLNEYLSMYNQREKLGCCDGPPVTGLRVYRLELPMAAAIANPRVEQPASAWVRTPVVEVDQ